MRLIDVRNALQVALDQRAAVARVRASSPVLADQEVSVCASAAFARQARPSTA